MTRVTKPKGKGKGGDADGEERAVWGGFVNVPLEADEKTHFKVWMTENETEIVEEVASTHLAGFKLSTVWDTENDCYIATLTGKGVKQHHPDRQYALSARGNDWWTAICLVIYKHVVCCDYDWSSYWSENSKRFGSEI